MKINLYPFQKEALEKLDDAVHQAIDSYTHYGKPQVIAYAAPTGAGKTIVMSALIESIFYGSDQYEGNRNSIVIWLSDDKDLNEQSKKKLETKSDKISPSNLVILDDNYRDYVLEDGKIYYINTQKLGKGTNLTKHSDNRTYTIWEILENTIDTKSNRLYLIIDEAHRGADRNKFAENSTIMQKFLKPTSDGLSRSMPVVIGISATIARFNKLVTEDPDIDSTIMKVETKPSQVRESGLLKDRIIVKYPDSTENDIAVMQAATDEWVDKTIHWQQFCREQHYERFTPVFIIQVQNTTGNTISKTNLDDCLHTIESRSGIKFDKGEVVHTFGNKNTLIINNLEVPYEAPANIQDNKIIKVVFFKDKLSTGWDCPRAETMVSFRVANDATYIAQLMGRMIRTPRGQRVNVDESLNDVCLFLPRFNKETVKEVLISLENQEGAAIPAEIETYSTKDDEPETITIITKKNPEKIDQTDRSKANVVNNETKEIDNNLTNANNKETNSSVDPEPDVTKRTSTNNQNPTAKDENTKQLKDSKSSLKKEDNQNLEIDREAAAAAINGKHFTNYRVRKASKNDKYWKSLFALIRPISDAKLDNNIIENVHNEILDIIDDHIEAFKKEGTYESKINEIKQFKLNSEVFDIYGDHNKTQESADFTTTDADIDNRFSHADTILGKEGIHWLYVDRHSKNVEDPNILNGLKIDVILFANNKDCMDDLGRYAKKRFEELDDRFRAKISDIGGEIELEYNRAVKNSSDLPKSVFKLGTNVRNFNKSGSTDKGERYYDHLFVGEYTGYVRIDLNTWEKKTIEEERQMKGYVCWLRNASRAEWALGVPYVKDDGELSIAFPDFIVVRRDEDGTYMVDLLEPHRPDLTDNLPKCKGFAKYAEENPRINRFQLIRQMPGRDKLVRLDLTKRAVREEVKSITTDDQLARLFERMGETIQLG